MYPQALKKYLYRKSCKAAIAAVKQIDLCKGSERTLLDIANMGIKVDLQVLQEQIKRIVIKKLEKEAGI